MKEDWSTKATDHHEYLFIYHQDLIYKLIIQPKLVPEIMKHDIPKFHEGTMEVEQAQNTYS